MPGAACHFGRWATLKWGGGWRTYVQGNRALSRMAAAPLLASRGPPRRPRAQPPPKPTPLSLQFSLTAKAKQVPLQLPHPSFGDLPLEEDSSRALGLQALGSVPLRLPIHWCQNRLHLHCCGRFALWFPHAIFRLSPAAQANALASERALPPLLVARAPQIRGNSPPPKILPPARDALAGMAAIVVLCPVAPLSDLEPPPNNDQYPHLLHTLASHPLLRLPLVPLPLIRIGYPPMPCNIRHLLLQSQTRSLTTPRRLRSAAIPHHQN
mmetsp:Transcript_32934/g.87362  ORF Transcript_32934/g.87362 Transcript_32934/m.87362 type:complete len:267 (+) Transcript_32934:501-1301(+)